jgi:hypothetical protein
MYPSHRHPPSPLHVSQSFIPLSRKHPLLFQTTLPFTHPFPFHTTIHPHQPLPLLPFLQPFIPLSQLALSPFLTTSHPSLPSLSPPFLQPFIPLYPHSLPLSYNHSSLSPLTLPLSYKLQPFILLSPHPLSLWRLQKCAYTTSKKCLKYSVWVTKKEVVC